MSLSGIQIVGGITISDGGMIFGDGGSPPGPPTLVSIVVTPANPAVNSGTQFSIQMTATGHYSDGSTQDLTTTASWTVSNVVYSVNSSGLVTIPSGTVNSSQISATYNAITGTTTLTTYEAGVNNVTGYNEMNPPVVAGQQLEDSTATINGTTGFTINNSSQTGVAITGCTVNNQNWFNANFTAGNTYTCTWGPGSTVASSSILVTNLPNGFGQPLVFFIQGQTGAATYNYPFTFSV